jgi:hypothetical protein
VAEALEEAFVELGGSAPLTRSPSSWGDRTPIILGANLLPIFGGPELPAKSIIFNLEQVFARNVWINESYLDLLRTYSILDYDRRNLESLKELGVHHARLLEIGYSPCLTRIRHSKTPEFDVFFYGSLTPRRQAVLDALSHAGLKVAYGINMYGRERDEVIARSKMVLNMHAEEDNVFEVVRVSYLLANRVCVVSEGDASDQSLGWIAGGLQLSSYDGLVDTCLALAGDAPRRGHISTNGFNAIAKRRQSALLMSMVLEASNIPIPKQIS